MYQPIVTEKVAVALKDKVVTVQRIVTVVLPMKLLI